MEEEHVGFLLEFEDQASEGLSSAASMFDVASAAFEKGIAAAVKGLTDYETSTARVATALYKADELWKLSTTRATALASSVNQATAAIMDFREESEFVMELPSDGWRIQVEERDFKEAGKHLYRAFDDEMKKERPRFFTEKDLMKAGATFGMGFDKDLSRSSFQRDLAGVIQESMLSGQRDALALNKRESFLGKSLGESKRGADPFGGGAFEKALAPFKTFLGQVRDIAVFAALFASFGQIFVPFLEVLADFFGTLFAPLEEFLLEIAEHLTPVVDDLAVAIYEGLQPAFDAFLKLLDKDIIPVLKDLVVALIPVFEWLVDLGVQVIQWVSDVFSGKKGVEAMNLAIGALITAALVPLGLAIYSVTAAFIAFTVALLTNPVTWVVVGIAAVVYALKEWAGGWDKLWKKTVQVFTAIKDFLGGIFSWIGGAFSALWDGIKSLWEGGLSGLLQLWWDYLSPVAWISRLMDLGKVIVDTITGLIGGIASTMADLGGGIVSALWNGITGGFASWVFPGPFGKLVGWMGKFFGGSDEESPTVQAEKSGAASAKSFVDSAEKQLVPQWQKAAQGTDALGGKLMDKALEVRETEAERTARSIQAFGDDVQAQVQGEPPIKVKVVPEVPTDEGDIPTNELAIATPEEQSAPVVSELKTIQRMLEDLFEGLRTRQGEGRVRRELDHLADFG